MAGLEFCELFAGELPPDFFEGFVRTQRTVRCWVPRGGEWQLVENPFTDDWDAVRKAQVTAQLQHTLSTGGNVFAAYRKKRLLGFAALEPGFLDREREYIELSYIHVSRESRGKGIGKRLFALAAKEARRRGARALYISTHPAEETQCFYAAVGCLPARRPMELVVLREPLDRQLECRFTD